MAKEDCVELRAQIGQLSNRPLIQLSPYLTYPIEVELTSALEHLKQEGVEFRLEGSNENNNETPDLFISSGDLPIQEIESNCIVESISNKYTLLIIGNSTCDFMETQLRPAQVLASRIRDVLRANNTKTQAPLANTFNPENRKDPLSNSSQRDENKKTSNTNSNLKENKALSNRYSKQDDDKKALANSSKLEENKGQSDTVESKLEHKDSLPEQPKRKQGEITQDTTKPIWNMKN